MSRRIFYSVIATVSLMIGTLIYVLFRENTHIAVFIDEMLQMDKVRTALQWMSCDFVKFYLPDLLWALSLCCGLFVIFDPNIRQACICAFTAFIYGILWELLQYCGIVSGTGDIHDIFMYLLAGIFAVIICLKRRNGK